LSRTGRFVVTPATGSNKKVRGGGKSEKKGETNPERECPAKGKKTNGEGRGVSEPKSRTLTKSEKKRKVKRGQRKIRKGG